MADSHKERSECRQRLLNALSAWEMAEFAIDPEDLGPMVAIFWGWSGVKGKHLVIPNCEMMLPPQIQHSP